MRATLAIFKKPLHELVVNRAMNQRTRARDARLPRGGEDAGHDAFDGVIEFRVREHDVGGFAAELHRHRFDVLGRRLVHKRAGGVATGEADLRDIRVAHERFARFATEPRHDVDDAGRQAGLGEKRRHRERRHGGMLGRLPDERVAGRERRRHLPRRQHQRRVPRHDGRDHAERLFEREIEVARPVDRDHAAFDLISKPAVVAEPFGQVAQLRAHLEDQLAVVGGLDRRELIGACGDQICELVQDLAARRRRQPAPFATAKRRVRGDHGAVDIGRRAARYQRPRVARVRIQRLEPLARGGGYALAADQHQMLLH
jgi:hypothetical protein